MAHRVDAAEAALAVAQRLGVYADRAHLVATGNHALVRLEPGCALARVTADGTFARFAGDLDVEVRVAAELHAAGAPVVPPLLGVPPRRCPAFPSVCACVSTGSPNEARSGATAGPSRAAGER